MNPKNLKHLNQKDLISIDGSGSYYKAREVCKRFIFDCGNYVIIPSTLDKNQDSDFLLRIFIKK